MQRCAYCGTEVPFDASFCGSCGHMLDTTNAIDGATYRSNEDQEERRRQAIPPAIPFPGALMGSQQPYASNVPMVQGTPQISGVPAVPGSPSSAGNLSPAQPFSQGSAPSMPSAFPHPQAPSPSYPVSQGAFPQTEQQLPHAYHPQTPPHLEPPPHHTRHPHSSKMHHALGAAPKVAGGSAAKWIIITIISIVVLGAGGAGAATYLLTRPQPVISVASDYKVGTTLAGTAGTTLHVSGQKFSGTSAITFLLDGRPVSGNQNVYSDANGNVRADLVITDAWTLGSHTLTARDTSNYATKNGVAVMIVQQGQANTPGPLGAPPDDASFKVNVSIQGQYSSGYQINQQEIEVITGHPDPMGGTVCQTEDNGQPIVNTGLTFDTKTPYRDTTIYSCAGTYKGGKLTFTETVISDVVMYTSYNPPQSCTLTSPHIDEQLSGSYTDQHMFSGTVTYPEIPQTVYRCDTPGAYFYHTAGQGTWTGQVMSS